MSEIEKYKSGELAYWTSIDGSIWHNDKIVQQLKAENEELKKATITLAKGLNIRQQCLDEIEEICKVNAINTCWTVLNLCDNCDEKEECGLQNPLQNPLSKLDAISNIIKQAKEGRR